MFSLNGLCENAGLLIFSCFTAFITIRHVQHIMPLCINLPDQNCDKFKTIVFWISAAGTKKKDNWFCEAAWYWTSNITIFW